LYFQLIRSIEFNQFQNKVRLPSSNIINGEIAILSGWGTRAFPSDSTSIVLQKSLMRIIQGTKCNSYLPYEIYTDQFCGFNSPGIGACLVSTII
jgi:hypothetical protein